MEKHTTPGIGEMSGKTTTYTYKYVAHIGIDWFGCCCICLFRGQVFLTKSVNCHWHELLSKFVENVHVQFEFCREFGDKNNLKCVTAKHAESAWCSEEGGYIKMFEFLSYGESYSIKCWVLVLVGFVPWMEGRRWDEDALNSSLHFHVEWVAKDPPVVVKC